MKISLPSTSGAGQPPRHRTPPQDDTSATHPAGGFTGLLAALQQGQRGPENGGQPSCDHSFARLETFDPAPAYVPGRPNKQSQAFERAQLLVDIAIEEPGRSPTASLGHLERTAEGTADWSFEETGTTARGTQLSQLLESLREQLTVLTSSQPTALMEGVHAPNLPIPVTRALSAPISARSADGITQRVLPLTAAPLSSRKADPGPSDLTAEAVSSSPAETASQNRASKDPFAAQLVASEGGLRLLVRLPRLAEGERAEVEAALTRLLTSFGHRRHEIVIQETGRT